MTHDWQTARVSTRMDVLRQIVDPSRLGDEEVTHYDIPSIQETGLPQIQPANEIGSSKLVARGGELLVSKLNPRKGCVTTVAPSAKKVLCSSEFVVLKPRRCDLRFAYYLFLSWGVREHLSALVQSATRSHQRAEPGDITKLTVLWPDAVTQQMIAAFLDRKTAAIDQLMEKKERLIELLQEKRQALITQVVTKGLDPSVPMKESGLPWLGAIPAHWRFLSLKRIADVDYGVQGELDRTAMHGTPILSLPNVTIDGRLDLSDVSLRLLTREERATSLLHRGDLLFNWRNGSPAHIGKTAMFEVDGEYTHVSFLLRIRPLPRLMTPRYLWLLLNGLRATGFFASSKFQVNVTYNQSELRQLRLPVPPIAEQVDVGERLPRLVGSYESLTDCLRKSVDQLQEYRQALISAAVTGQIDVTGEPA